jgi:hypothetical protein
MSLNKVNFCLTRSKNGLVGLHTALLAFFSSSVTKILDIIYPYFGHMATFERWAILSFPSTTTFLY